MVFTTAFVAVLITETLCEVEFATYTRLPSAFIEIPKGPEPTVVVAITVFVAVLTTETVPAPEFAVYNLLPSGLIVIPVGPAPTFIVDIMAFVPASITLIELEFWLTA